MENIPSGTELDGSRRHRPPRPKTSRAHAALGKSLSPFLIETGIGPLVLVGKAMQRFGLRTVISFVLGAGLVYGYAFVKGLPYLPKPAIESSALISTQALVDPEAAAKKIRLRGVVQDRDGRPVREPFMVGVLLKRFGPLRNSDGSFAIDVPKSSSYDLALWNMGGKMVQVYDGYSAERDGEGYILPPMLFPETTANTVAPEVRLSSRTNSGGHASSGGSGGQ